MNGSNYRPPRFDARGGRVAIESAAARLAYRTRATADLSLPARSTVRTGGKMVYVRRTRRDGSTYAIPLRVPTEASPVVRSEAPAVASKFRSGRTLRVGAGESFRDA